MLVETRVTDAGLKHLAGLTQLEGLNLRNSRMAFEERGCKFEHPRPKTNPITKPS